MNAVYRRRGLPLNSDVTEVVKMLSGEPVGYDTAKKFIYFMRADRAQHYIDWSAIGEENPLLADDYDDSADKNNMEDNVA